MKKIIIVELKTPIDGKAIYHFRSVKSIFDTLSEADIGRNYRSLWTYGIWRKNRIFENKKCKIKVENIL